MNKHHLRVLTYNIHKGFTIRQKFSLDLIRESIRASHSNLVFLQEIVGQNIKHEKQLKNWRTEPQLEYLADQIWPHHSYGKNAVYPHGNHGNALMSLFPITQQKHLNLSTNRIEQRGLLYCLIDAPANSSSKFSTPIHAICTHFDLFDAGRRAQTKKLIDFVNALENPDWPLLICGDFNDWNFKVDETLRKKLGVEDAYYSMHGKHAKTFPVQYPLLSLDRIYFRNLKLHQAKCLTGRTWNKRSDHAPIYAEFNV